MIPCKRPKVTVDPRTDSDTFLVRCHVPRCGFQYPQDLQFHALKSDADGMATMHRRAHRSAVPLVESVDLGAYHLVTCACGHQHRVHGTKHDAAAHVEYHLSSAHGLVSC